MDQISGNDESSPRSIKSTDDIGELAERMAKLWWHHGHRDRSHELPVFVQFSNYDNREGIWVDKKKYRSSRSIQANMERIWAKELYEMDAREREDIQNEIHGVRSSRTIDETPGMISKRLQSLREEIHHHILEVKTRTDNRIPADTTREAYQRVLNFVEQAGGTRVPYIHTEKFLLKFLRYTFFDVKKACRQYFRCLDLMYVLFGEIALMRPLMMSDLTSQEQQYLRKGQVQLLPCRDRIGRRIMAYSGREDKSISVPGKYRTCMYLLDVCSEDETTQKLGLVLLSSPRVETGAKPFGDGTLLRPTRYKLLEGLTEKEFYQKFMNGMSLRTSAIHFMCPRSFIYNIFKAFILVVVGKEDRKIIRFHEGSRMECSYGLRSFGVPIDELPLTEDGQIKNKRVSRFIEARKSIEDSRRRQFERGEPFADPGTECPEVNCIMFGNRSRLNSANLEFRNILKIMEKIRDERIKRNEEVSSVKDFIKTIANIAKSPPHNLRFFSLEKTTSLFVEITDTQELHAAISQSLRDQRKRNKQEKRQLEKARPAGRRLSNESFCHPIIGSDATKRRKGGSSSDGCCSL